MNYGDAIHHALVTLAREFDFPTITMTTAAVGAVRCTSTSKCVRPSTIIAYPTGSIFALPVVNRRDSTRRELQGQTWVLDLRFNGAVSLEEFEDSLNDRHPQVARDPEHGRPRQVDIVLEEAEYQTPVNQQPAQGTRVLYRLIATLSPT